MSKRGRRARDPEDDYTEDDVFIVREPGGRAAAVPRSLRNLDPDAREHVRALLELATQEAELQAHLAEHVAECRELGLSWASIGWAVGLTGEGARQRWGATVTLGAGRR